MRQAETKCPAIRIHVDTGYGRESVLRELRYGIEEEAIPFELVMDCEGDAVTLAWDASRASRLEVGLGLDKESLVLHFGKLERERPLFRISARSPREDIRAIGANAARLVKKLPFKPL